MSEKPGAPDDRITRNEAAEMLGRSRQTLAIWAHRKRGPPVHTDGMGRVYYLLPDLNAFLTADGKPAVRRTGRPPINGPGQAKQYAVTLATSKEFKAELVRAAQLSGRSLTAEVETRLRLSLEADRGKSKAERAVDAVWAELRPQLITMLTRKPRK